MHKKSSIFVTGLALAGSLHVLTGAEGAPPFGGLPASTAMFRMFCADQEPRFKAKIAFAEAKVGPQPAQRQSWDAFVTEASAAARPVRALCEAPPPLAGDDVLEELAFRQKTVAAILETDRGFLAAAQKLLVVLDSKQQRAFADSIAPAFPPVAAWGPPGPHP